MARCKLPIGHLLRFSNQIRNWIKTRPANIEEDGGGLLLLEVSDDPKPWFVWCDEHTLGDQFIKRKMAEAVVIDVSKAIAGLGEEGTAG